MRRGYVGMSVPILEVKIYFHGSNRKDLQKV